MAHESGIGGDVVMLGLLGAGAWFIWNWWEAQVATAQALPVAASSPTTTTTAPAATGPAPVVAPANPVAYTPPTVQQQMQTAANTNAFYIQGNGLLDADQWSAIWTQIGQTPINPTTFGNLFFPNGRPADPSQNPTMTLATFLAALQTQGLSGVGGPGSKLIPVPVVLAGKRTMVNLPAGTTPAQLQQMLRSQR